MNIIDNNYYENGAVHNDHRRNISIDAGAADAAEILRRILGEDEDFADYEVIGRQEEYEPAQEVRSRMFTTNMTDGNGKPADSVCQTRKGIGCIDPSKPVSLAILLKVAQEVGAVRADTGNTEFVRGLVAAGLMHAAEDEVKRLAAGMRQYVNTLSVKHKLWESKDKRELGETIFRAMRNI